MKKILTLFSFIVLTTCVFAQGIKFEHISLNEAFAKAKNENKLIFIDAFAVWCGPCKMMAAKTFKDKGVGEYFDKHFVALKIDVERGEGPIIKRKYAIEGLPGYIVLTANGDVVNRESGFKQVEPFMKFITETVDIANDPNSLSYFASQYESQKNDMKFVKRYLDKLAATKSSQYFDIFEHYLKNQKEIKENSPRMAELLYTHRNVLVYGGEADRILSENLWSYEWDSYVRKNVRSAFQMLYKTMSENTSLYAISKKDIRIIDLAIKRNTEECGNVVDTRFVYWDYYLNIEDGENYKKLAEEIINEFVNSLNIADLKAKHQITLKKMKENPKQRMRSFATRDSERLRYMARDYAKFVKTDDEKAKMLGWANICYDLVSDDPDNISYYACVLYMFDDKTKALELMKKAVELSSKSTHAEDIQRDYESMKKGETIILK